MAGAHFAGSVQYCRNSNWLILRELSFKVWERLWNQNLHPRVQIYVMNKHDKTNILPCTQTSLSHEMIIKFKVLLHR